MFLYNNFGINDFFYGFNTCEFLIVFLGVFLVVFEVLSLFLSVK